MTVRAEWVTSLKQPAHMPSPHKWAQARRSYGDVMCNDNIGAGLRSLNYRFFINMQNFV